MPSHKMHSTNHSTFSFLLNRELSEIYVAAGLRAFTITLLGFFVPLYLLQLGYSLNEVILYNIAWIAMYAGGVPFATMLTARTGLKHAMFLNAPFLAAYFFLLYTLPQQHWHLSIIALFYAASQLLYWPAFHVDFIRNSDQKRLGEQVGTLNAVFALVNAFAPLLAGLVIVFFGYELLFAIAMIIIMLSPLPLLFSKDTHVQIKVSLKDVLRKENTANFFAFFSEGVVNTAEIILWPIFIFLAVGNLIVIGGIGSIVLLFGTVFVYAIGRLGDKLGNKNVLNAGAIASAATWMFRIIFINPLYIVFISGMSGMTQTALLIPYSAIFYGKAAKKKTGEFVVFREMASSLGRAAVLLVLYVTGSFFAAFVLSAASSLSFVFF